MNVTILYGDDLTKTVTRRKELPNVAELQADGRRRIRIRFREPTRVSDRDGAPEIPATSVHVAGVVRVEIEPEGNEAVAPRSIPVKKLVPPEISNGIEAGRRSRVAADGGGRR